MKQQIIMLVLVATSIVSGVAVAQDKPAAKPRHRGGVALQLDLSRGGDEITDNNNTPYAVQSHLGDGVTVAMGGFYRLSESNPWELQALVGYKTGWVVPVYGGSNYGNVSSWVFHLLANYHYQNRWHFGGGLTFHGNPKYEDDAFDVRDYHFHSAVGATIEGGWSWLGVQCTYIEYGSLDASNCGVRFTWRFRKFGPLH
jgi:hypothetical protein